GCPAPAWLRWPPAGSGRASCKFGVLRSLLLLRWNCAGRSLAVPTARQGTGRSAPPTRPPPGWPPASPSPFSTGSLYFCYYPFLSVWVSYRGNRVLWWRYSRRFPLFLGQDPGGQPLGCVFRRDLPLRRIIRSGRPDFRSGCAARPSLCHSDPPGFQASFAAVFAAVYPSHSCTCNFPSISTYADAASRRGLLAAAIATSHRYKTGEQSPRLHTV